MKGWLDSPIDTFRQRYEEGVANWQAALAQLDAAYAEFTANQAFAAQDPQLAARWADLDGKVSFLQGTIETVAGAMQSVQDFFAGIGDTLGFSNGSTMQGLGFVFPAVPWALVGLVATGAAAVWGVVNQLRGFNVDIANRQIAQQNIANAQNGQPPIPYIDLGPPGGGAGGVLSDIGGLVKWGIGGAVILMLIRQFENTRALK